jgi:hypothetical protein
MQNNNLHSYEFIIDYASCINEDVDGNSILSPFEDTEDINFTTLTEQYR